MGITSRRENIIQSGRTKILEVDESTGGHEVSQQMDRLLLDDKGCDESRRGDSEVYNSRPPPVQPEGSPDDYRNFEKTVQDSRPSPVQPGGSPDDDRNSGKTVQDGRPSPVQPGGSPDDDRNFEKTVQDSLPSLVQPGGSPDDERNSGQTVQDGRPSPVQPGGSPDDDRNSGKTVQDGRPSPVQPEGSPDEVRSSGQTVQDGRPPQVQTEGSSDDVRSSGQTAQDGQPPPVQPEASPDDDRNSGQTVQDDAASAEESSVQNDLKSSPVTDHPASKQTEDMETFVTESTFPQTRDVQEQLPGHKESPSQSLPRSQENHVAKLGHPEAPPTEHAQSSCPDINVVEGSSEEPTSEAQEHLPSSHDHVKDDGTEAHTASLVGENNTLSNSEDELLGKKSNTTPGLNSPEDQKSATEVGNQEKPNQRVWSRTNDIIRQSQGVLVLTRSTDENAVFIPKLKFEFTPDNSIDWSVLGPPPLGNNKGDPTKMKDPRVLAACTPRGPTFSKSLLKKNFMLPGQDLPGGSSDSVLRFSGDVIGNNTHPLDRIVDLSISFQDKFGEQEIPADIPKILLTEEDIDED
ncbi:uncharacterized protein LOC130290850 isoform X2 [Hyla sarda]|nr:uncharacterized protein LOC130290850 isoform X2 [Hyla sarda]